jgi:hypothetical protein
LRRSRAVSAAMLALVTALVLLLSGCPSGAEDGPVSGYHLHVSGR